MLKYTVQTQRWNEKYLLFRTVQEFNFLLKLRDKKSLYNARVNMMKCFVDVEFQALLLAI